MCPNLPFETNWHFTKWDGLSILFVTQHIRCCINFWGSSNVLLQVPLKMGKNEENFESSIFFEAQKYYFVFESSLFFSFCKWSYLQRCFDVAQRCENRRWKWQRCLWRCLTLFNSMLLNVVNFNADIHNVVSTLVWRCTTSRLYINPKATLKRRWNVCWEFFSCCWRIISVCLTILQVWLVKC